MSVSRYGSTRWRAKVFSGGRLVTSKVFDLKRDADAWEAEQKRRLLTGQWVDPKAGTVPLREVIREYLAELASGNPKTFDTVEANLRLHVPASLQRLPIRTVTAGHLDAIYVDLLKKPLAKATVARVRDCLSSLYSWAIRKGYVQQNPVSESRLPRGARSTRADVTPFSAGDLAETLRMQRELNPFYAEITEFVSLTGLRWGEVVALRVGDFLSEPMAYIRVARSASDGYAEKGTKSDNTRMVPLVPQAEMIAMSRALGRRRDDYLFSSPRGHRLNGGNFKRAVRWDQTAAGHRFHDLRHTAASNWLVAGVDVKTVSKWLGHSSATVTLRVYAHWLGAAGDAFALQVLLRSDRSGVGRALKPGVSEICPA